MSSAIQIGYRGVGAVLVSVLLLLTSCAAQDVPLAPDQADAAAGDQVTARPTAVEDAPETAPAIPAQPTAVTEQQPTATAVAATPREAAPNEVEVPDIFIEITGPESFTSTKFGAVWDVELSGIMLVEQPSPEHPDCQVLLGTMVYHGSSLWATYSDAPDFYLFDGTETHYPVDNRCGSPEIWGAGYLDIDHAEITQGTAYPFAVAFETEAPAEHILLGPASSPESQQPMVVNLLDEVPEPDLGHSNPVELTGLGSLTAPNLTWQHRGPAWSVEFDGLVRVDDSCVVLAGALTPEGNDGQLVAAGDQPLFALIVDGYYTRPPLFGNCNEQVAEAAGYKSPTIQDLPANASFDFFTSFSVPSSATIQAVIVTTGASPRGALTLTAPVSETMTSPPASRSNSQPELPPLAGARGTATYQETTWEVRLDGMIETGISTNAERPGRCVDIYGTMAPIAFDGSGTASSQWTVPPIGIVHQGAFLRGFNLEACDNTAVERAGYRSTEALNVVAGTVHPFFVSVIVPEGAITAVAIDSDNDDGLFTSPDSNSTVASPDTSWSTTMEFETSELAGTRYSYSDRSVGWDYDLIGMVEVGVDAGEASVDSSGERCFALFGNSTPTLISSATEQTDPGSAPPITAFSDGYMLFRETERCDATALETAGYRPFDQTPLTVGESYPFYVMFLMPDDRDIDIIAVGRAMRPYVGGSRAIYVEPSISDAIQPAG